MDYLLYNHIWILLIYVKRDHLIARTCAVYIEISMVFGANHRNRRDLKLNAEFFKVSVVVNFDLMARL
jgi:hypothetical protein